jgi:hypothetical protein
LYSVPAKATRASDGLSAKALLAGRFPADRFFAPFARVIDSFTPINDACTTTNPSFAPVIASKRRVTQMTCLQSSRPSTRVNESITRVMDANTDVFELTYSQPSGSYPTSHRRITSFDPITTRRRELFFSARPGLASCSQCAGFWLASSSSFAGSGWPLADRFIADRLSADSFVANPSYTHPR